MSTITKQWLQKKIADMEAVRDEIPFGLDEDDSNTLAALRIALESLEAEPVCVIDQSNLDYLNAGSDADVWPVSRTEMGDVLLYRTAPPAPVSVPDAATAIRACMEEFPESVHDIVEECAAIAESACRAAMLKHSEPFIVTSDHRMMEMPQVEAINAMLQGAEPVTTAYKLTNEIGSSLQLRNLIRQRHAEWSQATFGDVGPVGPLKHLSKEALEAAAEPNDLSEWADMQFLLWDAQRRAGISDGEITAAMEEKLKVNMARQWPEPKDGEPRLHIKTAPLQEVKP